MNMPLTHFCKSAHWQWGFRLWSMGLIVGNIQHLWPQLAFTLSVYLVLQGLLKFPDRPIPHTSDLCPCCFLCSGSPSTPLHHAWTWPADTLFMYVGTIGKSSHPNAFVASLYHDSHQTILWSTFLFVFSYRESSVSEEPQINCSFPFTAPFLAQYVGLIHIYLRNESINEWIKYFNWVRKFGVKNKMWL